MSRLDGRRVLITGGGGGIGRAVARACVEAGARVLVCGRREAPLREVADALGIAWCACDVTKRAQVEQTLDALETRLGGPPTAVVHAAAVIGPIGLTADVDPDAWWDAVHVNLFGTFLVVREASRRMPSGGRIVVFSGGGAATPFPRFTAYASAKAAVVRLAESLADELAPRGIEINALAPGMIATPMHDETLQAGEAAGAAYLAKTQRMLAKGGFPVERAAAAAVFLASDDAAGITGRLLAAPWDDWASWPAHRDDMRGDLFTLRRVVPRDRGMDWQ